MQNIIIYLRAGDVAATVVDEYNQTAKTTPTITRGMRANLCLRPIDSEGNPIPAENLDYVGWDFVLANDWNTSTDPQIRVQTGFTVSSVTVGDKTFSQITIPLTETNTTQLVEALGSSASVKLGAELAGFESGESDPGFLIQFDVNVRNRRGTAGTGTPEPVGDGTYSAVQIDVLLDAKAEADHNHDGVYAPLEHTHESQAVPPLPVMLAVPGDADDDALHLQLEVSENADFSDPAESVDTSTSQANVEVYDGSGWGAFPAAGLGTPFYGSVVSVALQNVQAETRYYLRYHWWDGTDYTDWLSATYPSHGIMPVSEPPAAPEIISLEIPTDSDDHALHLQLELSANSDLSDPVESIDTSVSQGNVELFDGTEWIAFPATGAGTPYYGLRVAVTLVNLTSGQRYYLRFRWFDGTDYTDWNSTIYPASNL